MVEEIESFPTHGRRKIVGSFPHVTLFSPQGKCALPDCRRFSAELAVPLDLDEPKWRKIIVNPISTNNWLLSSGHRDDKTLSISCNIIRIDVSWVLPVKFFSTLVFLPRLSPVGALNWKLVAGNRIARLSPHYERGVLLLHHPAINWFFLKNIWNVYHSFLNLDTIIQILFYLSTSFLNFLHSAWFSVRPQPTIFTSISFFIFSSFASGYHSFHHFLPASFVACIILAARSAHRRFIKGMLIWLCYLKNTYTLHIYIQQSRKNIIFFTPGTS